MSGRAVDMRRARLSVAWMSLFALLALSGCISDEAIQARQQPGGDDGAAWLDAPPVGGLGGACFNSADCEGALRCLDLDGERFCVQTCRSDQDCSTALCNPVFGSQIGWCELPTAPNVDPGAAPDPGKNNGDPTADMGFGPDADEPDADGPDASEPDASAPDSGKEPPDAPDPGVEIGQGARPGQECDCDADCAPIGGYQAFCVVGICMARGTSSCSSSGSGAECPQGMRCWNGRGVPICYPDCDAYSCAGGCDGDGSCVPRQGQDCYQSCGSLCNTPGSPPGGGGPNPDPNVPDEPQGECGSTTETEQFNLMNQDRARSGLRPLTCHPGLVQVAHDYSEDMARRRFFSHTNPEGQQPWDRVSAAGISGWRSVGENIAYGQRTPAEVQQAWMNSSGHRRNILNSGYTHIGVGAYNHNGTWYWTQVFATF